MANKSRMALLAFVLLSVFGWRDVAQAAAPPRHERVMLIGNLNARTLPYSTDTNGAPAGQVSLTVVIRDRTARLHRLELVFQKLSANNEWVYLLTSQTAETAILANATGVLTFSPRGKPRDGVAVLVRARFSNGSPLLFILNFSRMTQLRRPTHLTQVTL